MHLLIWFLEIWVKLKVVLEFRYIKSRSDKSIRTLFLLSHVSVNFHAFNFELDEVLGHFLIAQAFFNIFEKAQGRKNSRIFQAKTQRSGSDSSHMDFETQVNFSTFAVD